MISSIEEEAEIRVSARAADLLAEMIGENVEPSARGRGRPRTFGYSDKTPDEKREYKADKAREGRSAQRSAIEKGALPYNAATARAALADAALLILAGDKQGAENIRSFLRAVYASAPGAPLSIEAAARSGAMKPKYRDLIQVASI